MRRPTALLLLALALVPAGLARAGDDATSKERQKRIEEAKKARADAERRFGERVNAAIDKGAKWLAALQAPDGSWPGITPGTVLRQDMGEQALCILTLVKCGADASDSVVKRGLRRLHEMYEVPPPSGWNLKGTKALMTYSVATMLLLYDALYEAREKPANAPKPGEKAPPAAPSVRKPKLTKDGEATVRELADWLVVNQEGDVWRYPGPSVGLNSNDGVQDISHAQYALLALQAAARLGVEVRAIVYQKALRYLLANQAPTGPEVVRWSPNPAYEPGGDDPYGPFVSAGKDQARGWSYLPQSRAYMGGTTAAGLVCLAVVKDRLRAADKLDKDTASKIDRAMLDGLAWLASNFTVAKNPGATQVGWHLAYLYTMERAGSLLAKSHIGQHDWYHEGAEVLLELQKPDGGWSPPTDDINRNYQPRQVQTCFALLFLDRGTPPPELPVGPVTTGD